MMKLGGYFTSLTTARKVAAHHNIDIGPDDPWTNLHMEWPINSWLHDNNMLHMKAAVISSPTPPAHESGLFWISTFDQNDSAELKEDDETAREVKSWLGKSGVEDGEMKWMSRVDNWRIVLGPGDTQPERSKLRFKKLTPEELLASTFD